MELHPYKIPIKEMIKRYEDLYVAAIEDVFQERGLYDQWLGPDIKCITLDLTLEVVAGFAFTVHWITDTVPDDRPQPAAKMVQSYPEDSIIVVDLGKEDKAGAWGELATTVAVNNGVKGAVINGGAKDTGFVRAMGFPIFAKYSTPVDGFYRNRLNAYQVPIWFGNRVIYPGDFIVGDRDGVVVIPQAIAEEVLVETERRATSENETRNLLKQGIPADEAARRTGRKDL